jgi:hypothetical protein
MKVPAIKHNSVLAIKAKETSRNKLAVADSPSNFNMVSAARITTPNKKLGLHGVVWVIFGW